MTKKTCTPRRKALAKRFKKGIESESKKRVLTLNEAQMKELLKKIIHEAAMMDGTTEKAISDSGKENEDYLKALEEKIKKYLSFEGNDNPEFPHQIGKGSEDKKARQNTGEEDDFVDVNRGGGMEHIDYDNPDESGELPKPFKDRMEKGIERRHNNG